MDLFLLASICATFLLAGAVKGVIGLGLPTISLAILTVLVDLPSAMALLLAPSFLTNVWQATAGGQFLPLLKRLWLFLLLAACTVWIGALALTRIDLSMLSALLGLLIAAYALINLGGVRIFVPKQREVPAGAALGAINGVLTGMTGSFVVPGVMYLQAIGLQRDALVQAMGILFTISTLALAFALGANNLLTMKLGTLSLIAVIPAFAGMAAGQYVRQRLSESVFKRIFFVSLLLLGCYIVWNAVLV